MTARSPGAYIMTFDVYGSLLNLFPNPPQQMQINVEQGRKFKISVQELDGITVYNNQWSSDYTIQISELPDADKFESDIIVTHK